MNTPPPACSLFRVCACVCACVLLSWGKASCYGRGQESAPAADSPPDPTMHACTPCPTYIAPHPVLCVVVASAEASHPVLVLFCARARPALPLPPSPCTVAVFPHPDSQEETLRPDVHTPQAPFFCIDCATMWRPPMVGVVFIVVVVVATAKLSLRCVRSLWCVPLALAMMNGV